MIDYHSYNNAPTVQMVSFEGLRRHASPPTAPRPCRELPIMRPVQYYNETQITTVPIECHAPSSSGSSISSHFYPNLQTFKPVRRSNNQQHYLYSQHSVETDDEGEFEPETIRPRQVPLLVNNFAYIPEETFPPTPIETHM